MFHRLIGWSWTMREPEAIAHLTPDERRRLPALNVEFRAFAWRTLESHPFINDVAEDESAIR